MPVWVAAIASWALLLVGLPSVSFETGIIQDPNSPAGEVVRFLKPVGWSTRAELQWMWDEPAPRAELVFEMRDPAGRSWLRLYPSQSFLWEYGRWEFRVPAESGLVPDDVARCPPRGATAFLREIFLPQQRPGASALDVQPRFSLEGLPEAFEPGGRPGAASVTSFDGAGVTATYHEAGTDLVEELWCVIRYQSYSVPSMAGPASEVLWTADPIVSLGVRDSGMERFLPVWQTVLRSMRLSPIWYGTYREVLNRIAAAELDRPSSRRGLRDALAHAAEMARSSDEGEPPYEQVALSAIVAAIQSDRAFTSRYSDPRSGTVVDLPAGYEYAWTDGQGRYRLSPRPRPPGEVGRRERWYLLEPVE